MLRAGLLLPHLLHLQSAAAVFPAHRAITLKASAMASGVDMMKMNEVVDPRRHVNRLRQAGKEATARTMQPNGLPAVFRPKWRHSSAVNLKPSIKILLTFLSQPPLHGDGVQPLTNASTQVTSLA